MAASSNLDGAVGAASESKSFSENGKSSSTPSDDGHSRFGLNMGIGELLQNWGLLNLSPFRRKPSKPGTPSPLNQSPQKQMQAPSKTSPDVEHIELVQLSNIKVSDALWKNIHSNLAMPGDVFFTNMPGVITSKPLLQKLEGEQGVCNMDFILMDRRPKTQETKLRNSSTFVWTHEEEVEGGKGHDFSQAHCNYPTWCDMCGDLLWCLYETSYLRCRYCHYTCHPHCQNLVKLDCRGENDGETGGAALPDPELESVEHVVQLEEISNPSLEPLLQEVSSEEDSGLNLRVSHEHLQHLITEYNAANPSGPDMTLEEDGSTFRGFIRVHMNLCRPISVVAGTRPPSIYDILKDDETLEKTLTSFYLPRDTVKALHVTSETTTHEVIKALLKKFKVVDNPRKFALYERHYEQGETAKVKMRRIAESEKPLVLALRWSREENCNKMFVLQENETGDILWEAFTLPELNNFLRILDREEEEYKNIVRKKYQFLGSKIQEAMDRLQSVQQRHRVSKVQGVGEGSGGS
ncbi:ras association domain-containing protein 1-like isoform X2 [Zootermopsis nevadensis]|uniref:ras association domain-containing protein 1-like isoform X2 n=1 Tax=Zootermopsis nevadensis TaxID=136037 RepID=UPI000B8E26A5|nr:ras association domain-containing protein 1-like isoform X2 [Zootermopsis nevadensis]